jgi:hypothetical protein
MKKGLLIFAGVGLISLVALIWIATLQTETLYYTPVINSTGEKVAYVKRQLKYSAWGGSCMPFFGGSPTKIRIHSDRTQVCEKDLRTGRETILADWKLRLINTDSRGRLHPVLNWELENLRYVIKMHGFGDIGIGKWRRPYNYLSNLGNWSGLQQGPAAAGTVRVRLDRPVRGKLPATNSVAVEKTWVAATELPKIRQALVRLNQQRLAELNQTLQNRGDPGDAEAIRDKAEIERLNRLSDFMAGQPLAMLPIELVGLFCGKPKSATKIYPDLTPYVTRLGAAGVAPLVKAYGQVSLADRLRILAVLGDIGSWSALTLIRKAVHAPQPDLQNASIVALRKVKGARAPEELVLLLGDARLDSAVKATILSQLQAGNAPDWQLIVLRTALQDPLIFAQLPDLVPDFNAFPEEVVWRRLPALYDRLYIRKDRQTIRITQHLVATIRSKNYLPELYPVLGDLLKSRYDYGRTTDVFGGFTQTGTGSPATYIAWDRGMASHLLERIETDLEDVVHWHALARRNRESQLTLLYLEDLLNQRGIQIRNRPPIKVLLELNVQAASGTVVAAGRQVVVAGEPVTLRGKPLVPGYAVPACAGRLILDKENWRLTFTPLMVQQKPEKIAVPVSIPFGGGCEFRVNEKFPGKKQRYRWTLRHIDER